MCKAATLLRWYCATVRAIMLGPPYPVSASAIKGVLVSKFAVISACSRISFRVAKPRSGWPSFEAQVPAPVYVCDHMSVNILDIRLWQSYHINTIKSDIESYPGTKPSKTKGATIISFSAINCRRRVAGGTAMAINCREFVVYAQN